MSVEKLKIITGDLEIERSPRYRIGEVAKFFFAKSPHWVRWRERSGALALNGERWTPSRGEGVQNSRDYDLADVEVMVRLLLRSDAISPRDHDQALACVAAQADLYRMDDRRYELGGIDYLYGVADVVDGAEVSADWVYRHAEELGGVKRHWDDGHMADAWRFPSDAIDKAIEMAPARPTEKGPEE